MKPKLSIIMCCYNKIAFTLHALNTLFYLPQGQVEIIVVDNGSTDETPVRMREIAKGNLQYIRNDINLFHSGGCNIGYNASTGETILFLNNDIGCKSSMDDLEGWAGKLLDAVEKHPNTLIGKTAGYIDPKKDYQFVYETIDSNKPYNYISGWLVAAKRETWDKLKQKDTTGPWDNVRMPLYFNDADISMRAEKLGIGMKLIELPLDHFGKISSSQMNVPKLYNDARKTFVGLYGKKDKSK